MDQKTKVLIIGAGPTGLMAACQLAAQGIDAIIIDQKEGIAKESRALVLHARSLEIYDQMDLANEALLQGEIVHRAQIIVEKRKPLHLNFGNVGEGLSPFPFLLILEQSKNEALLHKYLKQHDRDVLWNTELLSILEEEEGVRAVVRTNEETFEIVADYVIAADGAKSFVRNSLEVPFAGDTYEHVFFVADTKVESVWGKDELTVYFSNQTFMALFPMQGENRFRVIGVLPKEYQNESPESFDELIPHIQKQVSAPVSFTDTNWFSVYRLHHRCVDQFRKGRIFFAGDAAHIHSPAGGQGMNTGLQDAYNLAWKLAFVIKGHASDKLLDTYNEERLPFAQQLIRSTDKAFSIVTSDKWYHKIFRLRLLPLFLSFWLSMKKTRLRGFRAVSQIGIKYINSDLTVNRLMQVLSVKAGERFPFFKTADGENLYDRFKANGFHALVFSVNPDNKLLNDVLEMQQEFPSILHVLDLSEEKAIIESLKIKSNIIILLRPDHYIGLLTDEGAKVAGDYLRKLAEEKKEESTFKLTQTHE